MHWMEPSTPASRERHQVPEQSQKAWHLVDLDVVVGKKLKSRMQRMDDELNVGKVNRSRRGSVLGMKTKVVGWTRHGVVVNERKIRQ